MLKIKLLLIVSLFLITIQLSAQIDTASIKSDSSEVEEYILLNSGEKVFGKFEFIEGNQSFYINTNYFLFEDSTNHERDSVKAFQNKYGYFAKIFEANNYAKRKSEGNVDLYKEGPIIWPNSRSHTYFAASGPITTFAPIFAYGAKVKYFTKKNDKILTINYDNLREELKDNIKSMALLDEYRRLSYLKYGTGAIGLGLIASIFIREDEDNFSMFTKAGAGIVLISLSSYIHNKIQKQKLNEAIEVYNGLR